MAKRLVVGCVPGPEEPADGLADTEAFPEGRRGHDRAVLQGPLELDVLGKAGPFAVLVLGRVDDLDTADPGDGAAEPDQGLAVQLIGAAEVVDDLLFQDAQANSCAYRSVIFRRHHHEARAERT